MILKILHLVGVTICSSFGNACFNLIVFEAKPRTINELYVSGLVYEGVPNEVFLILPFSDKIPQGIINFHEAFFAKE